MRPTRPASKVDIGFPYTARDICWIEMVDGEMTQVDGLPSRRASVKRAIDGETTLYAVWPGQWRSDLFHIDDLQEAAVALGVRS